MIAFKTKRSFGARTVKSAVFDFFAMIAVGAGCVLSQPARAHSGEEARATSQQALALIYASKIPEAITLAQKGLTLCDDAGAFTPYCVGVFNELLGDAATAQSNYPDALRYYEKSLEARQTQLGPDNRLVGLTHLKIGRTLVALHRNADAESALKNAVANFQNRMPVERELGAAQFELERIYIASLQFDDAVTAGRAALDAYTAVQGTQGASIPVLKRVLGSALLLLGDRQVNAKNLVDAEKSISEGIKLFDPPDPGWETQYAKSLFELGKILDLQGRFAAAEPYEQRALEYRSGSVDAADPLLLQILLGLAGHYEQIGKTDESTKYAGRIVAVLDQRHIENSTLGSALVLMARAQRARAQYADADVTFARALKAIDRVARDDDPQRLNVRIGIALLRMDEERFEEAEQQYREALSLGEKQSYAETSWRSSILAGLGAIYRDTGRYQQAEEFFLEAMKIDEAAARPNTTNLANRLTGLASVYRRQARYADAEKALLRALTMTVPDVDRANALNSLGLIYSTVGQYAKAEQILNEALTIERRMLSETATLTLDTLTNLAEIDLSNSRFLDAETKRRDILSKIAAREPPQSTAIALHSTLLAATLVPQGKLDEAEDLGKRAVTIYENRLGPDHPRVAAALTTVASIEALRGRDSDAEAHYRRALAIDERALGADNSTVAGILVSLSPVLQRLDKRGEAKADVDRALTIMTTQFGRDNLMTVGAMLASANLAYEEARYQDAQGMIDRVQAVQERALGPDHPALAESWVIASRIAIDRGRLDAASSDIDRAAQIVGKALPPGHPSNIDLLEGNADVALARGDLAGAEQYDRKALALADRSFRQDHPVHLQAVDRVVGMLWANNKRDEAKQIRESELKDVLQNVGEDNPVTARVIRKLAALFAKRSGDAITLYKRALKIDEQVFGSSSREVAWDDVGLGSILISVGRFDAAEISIKNARMISDHLGALALRNAVLDQLAKLAAFRGSVAEGLVHAEAMMSVAEELFGTQSPALVPVLTQLGQFYLVNGRINDAAKIMDRINALVGDDPAEQSPGFLNSLQFQAMLKADRNDISGAETTFKHAIAVAAKYRGQTAPEVASAELNLAIAYLKSQKFDAAIEQFNSAIEILREQNGDGAVIVGYAFAGEAAAYASKGDQATSKQLFNSAIKILGSILPPRSQPRWL